MAGACASEYWAGLGVNHPLLDVKCVGQWQPAKKLRSSSKKELEKTMMKLEGSLQQKEDSASDTSESE